MPRKKATAEQQREIFRLLGAGVNVSDIRKHLIAAFPNDLIVQERMLYRYKEFYERSTDFFALDKLPGLGLSASINLSLMDLWKDISHVSEDGTPTFPLRSDTGQFDFTMGEARWFGYLWPLSDSMSATEQLSRHDVYLLAILCDSRERIAVAMKEEAGFTDVLAYLSFRPWVSEIRHLEYMRAIKCEIIKPIQYMELMASALTKTSQVNNRAIRSIPDSTSLPMMYSQYPGDFFYEALEDSPDLDDSLDLLDPVGRFPKPLQYLAWAKLAFFGARVNPAPEGGQKQILFTHYKEAPLASDETRSYWYQLPPFQYNYSDLSSIAELLAYDSVLGRPLCEDAQSEWFVVLKNIPERIRNNIERILEPVTVSALQTLLESKNREISELQARLADINQ